MAIGTGRGVGAALGVTSGIDGLKGDGVAVGENAGSGTSLGDEDDV